MPPGRQPLVRRRPSRPPRGRRRSGLIRPGRRPRARGRLYHAAMTLDQRPGLPLQLVGDGLVVTCLDGEERPYLNLDAAASTNALPAVARRVAEFLPWYSSGHRGAGDKSRQATDAYEQPR